MKTCPICGTEFIGLTHCGDDNLIYIATYGEYPQPEGYPMTLEKWQELNPGIDALYGR